MMLLVNKLNSQILPENRINILVLFIIITMLCTKSVIAKKYYIDQKKGSDQNSGNIKHPWQTLRSFSTHHFDAGDTILFRNGSQFTGNFQLKDSGTEKNPIVLSAYGKGKPPRFTNPVFTQENMGRVLEIKGSYIVIEKLFFHDNPVPPSGLNPKLRHSNVTQMGVIFIHKGANYNVVKNCELSNSPIGIRVRGEHNVITNNYLHDADSITFHWGSIAIVVVGAGNEIAFNKIHNYGYYGGNFGLDGAAIELDGEDKLYDAHDINIHHNVSSNTKGGFIEITGMTENVTIAFNVSDDIDKFVGAVGVKNLHIVNNTIIRMRNPDFNQIVFWQLDQFAKRNSEFLIENNLIYINDHVRIYDTQLRNWGIKSQPRRNNLYFSPDTDVTTLMGVTMEASDFVCDPQFANLRKERFGLKKSSLALLKGVGAYIGTLPEWIAGIEIPN